MIIRDLVRKELKKIKTYTPSKTIEEISQEVGIPVEKILKLDSGENLYTGKVGFYLYPDPACQELRQKLSSYTGYDPQWIVCGNGSDELIDLLIKVFVSPGEEIIISPPTFSMYEFYGQLYGAKIKSVLRDKNLYINTKKIVEEITAKTKIIFIDSPGNPSSVVISPSDVEKLLKEKVIVVLDEAYFEYCGQTVLPLLRKYSNLVVLRTFSKWAGLAGLRVGYMLADPEIINLIFSVKPPYNVNSVAQNTAVSILDNKEKYLKVMKKLVGTRDKFITRLSKFSGLEVYPSQGAYIILKPEKETEKMSNFLRLNGILVKIINQPLLESCIRINLVDKNNMDRFIKALGGFYEN